MDQSYAIVEANGFVSSTTTSPTPLPAPWVGCPPEVNAGWWYLGGEWLSPVPEEITPRQMRLWLNSQSNSGGNFLTQALASINAESPGKRERQIEWEYATTVRRDNSLVAAVGSSLGLSNSQLDQAFRTAATL